jgi:hypothetical protein
MSSKGAVEGPNVVRRDLATPKTNKRHRASSGSSSPSSASAASAAVDYQLLEALSLDGSLDHGSTGWVPAYDAGMLQDRS